MKAYNEYMNRIFVSDTLHQKLLSCATDVRTVSRTIIVKRYAAAIACIAIVFLSIFTMPQLLQHNVTPTPGDNPSVLQPGTDVSTPGISKNYMLIFNKADRETADKILIPGHFWQKLNNYELQTIFPNLTQKYSVSATANYKSDETGAALFNIDAQMVSTIGLKPYVQIAPAKAATERYKLSGDVKTSDVLGTSVTAGYFENKPNSKEPRDITYFASFKLSGIAYYVELRGRETEKEALKEEVSKLIGLLVKGGAADLGIFHPVVPELREDRLNVDVARADADFGKYLPVTLPDGFVFEDALRFVNQERNELIVHWKKGMGYIDWRVSKLNESDKIRITSSVDKRNYDLSLYPIPQADSVPDDLREIVDNPIFLIDELTLGVVRSRTYEVSDTGDESGPRMRFSVLYGDILVKLSVKGASPEAMFNILQHLRGN